VHTKWNSNVSLSHPLSARLQWLATCRLDFHNDTRQRFRLIFTPSRRQLDVNNKTFPSEFDLLQSRFNGEKHFANAAILCWTKTPAASIWIKKMAKHYSEARAYFLLRWFFDCNISEKRCLSLLIHTKYTSIGCSWPNWRLYSLGEFAGLQSSTLSCQYFMNSHSRNEIRCGPNQQRADITEGIRTAHELRSSRTILHIEWACYI
jgi:hypothetical protein